MRNLMLAAAGWLTAAGAAVAVGLLALHLIDDHVTGSNTTVTSQQAAAQALAHATGRPPASPTGSATPAPPRDPAPQPTPVPRQPSPTGNDPGTPPPATQTPPQSSTQALSSTGGTVVARCQTDDLVQLLSWTPRQGYEVEETIPGPATTAYVKFEAEDIDVIVTISCSGAVPFQQEVVQPDD